MPNGDSRFGSMERQLANGGASFGSGSGIGASSSASEERVTSRTMSQYEAAALLALRTQQLATGCASTLLEAATEGKTPEDIAQMELDANKIPIVVSRVLPDGRHEDIPAKFLRVPGDFRP